MAIFSNPPPTPGPRVVTNTTWIRHCQATANGGVINNLANAALGLRLDPALAGILAYNEMLCSPVVRSAVPGAQRQNGSFPRAVEDADRDAVQEYLQLAGIKRLGRGTVDQAIDLVAQETCFHPLRDDLVRLAGEWDGNLRLSDWPATYLGAASTPYTQAVGAFFLTGMVNRVFQPGCQMDYMLILIGDQGETKSKVCRVLAGNDYFSNTLPDLGSDYVRLCMHLRGKWVIEIPELHQFFNSRVDATKLKAFLTTQVEQYTPKFGRREAVEPRQCVFIGTTNKEVFLRDETGNRRFWPIKCGTIDIDALIRDRDQLIGEAVLNYQNGGLAYPDREFERKYFYPEQDARYEDDAWESALATWDFTDITRDEVGKPIYHKDPQTGDLVPAPRTLLHEPYYLIEIASGALGIEPDKLAKGTEMRLSKALEAMRWRRQTKTNRGRPWLPPVTP